MKNQNNIYKNEMTIKWNMDLDNPKDIKRVLINKFYELGLIFETLEYKKNSKDEKIILGNGHHKAQEIAEYAGKMFDRDRTDKISE